MKNNTSFIKMQTILKEIVLTNMITYDNHISNNRYYNYDLHGHNNYDTSYLTKNITYEVIKIHIHLAIYIKYEKYINLNDYKDLIQTTCVMKWLRCASDDIKIFAIKDNLVNLSLIYNPTDEMVDFIKDDERFEVIKYPIFDRLPDEKLYCNFVFITNEDKLNEKETKKYFQSYQLYL